MNRIVTAALIAVATTAASWAVRRWLDRHDSPPSPDARVPLETWENEGGAVAPGRSGAHLSQVPG